MMTHACIIICKIPHLEGNICVFLTSLMYALRRNNVNSLRTQFNSVTLLLDGLVRMVLTKLIVSVVF